jgi:hypothetical protein
MGTLFLTFGVLTVLAPIITAETFRWGLFVVGIGMGTSFVPLLLGVQASLERRDLGSGTSSFQLLRSLGGSFGVTILGTILAVNMQQNSQFEIHAAIQKIFLANATFSLLALITAWKIPSHRS